MGYSNSVVEEALKQQKFDDCYASYLLLGRRNTDVSIYRVPTKFISTLGAQTHSAVMMTWALSFAKMPGVATASVCLAT